MKYLCEIRYLGTAFCGFQVQPGKRTVQEVLQAAAESFFTCSCKVTGCSRTDSGVHAESFYVTLEPSVFPEALPPDRLPLAMAPYLPSDLSVCSCRAVPDGFHPRYDAKGKEYVYLIDNAPVADPFLFCRAWHLPRTITDDRVERMRKAAGFLIGKHDFAAFMAAGSDVADTVRTLFDLRVEKENDRIRIVARGDGFLYNMVRILVGTLVDVAFGKMCPEDMEAVLSSCDRRRAGMTAPADGLYLHRVFY